MNYYERYLGDYGRDTGHLSLAQHGAYSLLLDAYYSNEAALASDIGTLYRICRAMSKTEQESVRSVADEFFPIADDGLRHNARADIEISKAQARIQAARANGKRGGRKPKINPLGNPAGFNLEPSGNPLGNPVETQWGTQQTTQPGVHHTPYTNKPKSTTKPPAASAASFSPPEWVDPEAWTAFIECRKRLRAQNTPYALKLITNSLTRFKAEGHDPNEIIKASIRSGWKDVYGPKPEGSMQSKKPDPLAEVMQRDRDFQNSIAATCERIPDASTGVD